MPAIKPVPYQTLAKIFESEGFTLHRKRGDHLIYSKTSNLQQNRG